MAKSVLVRASLVRALLLGTTALAFLNSPFTIGEASAKVGVTSAAEMSAVVAAAMSPPPDLDWDEMAIDDPEALSWAAA